MGFSIGYGIIGVGSAIFVLVSLSQVSLIPVELSLTNLSIIELRDNPNEPKGISLEIGEVRIHHYMIGIAIILTTLVVVYVTKKKKRNKIFPISTFFLGFGGFLIFDQLPNIVTGIWDKPVF